MLGLDTSHRKGESFDLGLLFICRLLASFRSYYGGFLCVSWSHDGKFLATGGEDDLVSIWSFHERSLLARGQGHRSWVSCVRFDPFYPLHASGKLGRI